MIGQTIGHYRVLEKLGEGGMGEVYLAQDTSLGRSVALKFLPASLAADEIAQKRFLREARSAANLDHPYICNVFEVAQTEEGIDFIAMEYLEGETLQRRLERGPLSLKETLKLGSELAEALESAHGKGIVHRDLKPANIMLTPAGHAKVMDFGLAKKLVGDDGREQDISSALTREGATLGTLSYMSPEQLRGQPVDYRSDIFSLGIVLYEMLGGVHPFRKTQATETTGAILKDDPAPLARYVTELPEILRHTVEKMLAKEPSERFQSVHEVLTNLNQLREESGKIRISGTARKPLMPEWFWIALCALMGVVIAAMAIWSLWLRSVGSGPEQAMVRSRIHLSPEICLTAVYLADPAGGYPGAGSYWPIRTEFALSPGGGSLVFSGSPEDLPGEPNSRSGDLGERVSLYRMLLDTGETEAIPGTEGAHLPFFSPDGAWIGFWAGGRLMKVPDAGGIPSEVGSCPDLPMGATWADNGLIILGTVGGGLRSVSAAGGPSQFVTEIDRNREVSHHLPFSLPGGDDLLVTTMRYEWGPACRVELLTLSNGARRVLIEDAADARYVSTGHLLFMRRGSLMATAFDLDSRAVTGPAVPVQQGVQQALNLPFAGWNSASGQYSVSNAGLLIYLAGGIYESSPVELVWVDRKGQIQRVEGFERTQFAHLAISPGGHQVAFVDVLERSPEPGSSATEGPLWLFDLERQTLTKLVDSGASGTPVWSPDGGSLVYTWSSAGPFNLWMLSPGRGEQPLRLLESVNTQFATSWSPDGQYLLYWERGDVWSYHFESGVASPFLDTPYAEAWASFSPDGKYVVYSSDATGRQEVYVTSFPDRGNTVTISSRGGGSPLWSPDGSELFFRGPEGMMKVDVDLRAGLKVGRAVELFRVEGARLIFKSPILGFDYDARRNCFLFTRLADEISRPENQGITGITRLEIVTHWFEELRARVPVE